jgi:phosphoglycolate phosphatase-like HAD superfamily hydrolase
MKKKLLLFDIDGTLVSVERNASRQLLRDVALETLGIIIPQDYVFELGGKTDFQIMHELAADFHLPPDAIDKRREEIAFALTKATERLSSTLYVERLVGVAELLRELVRHQDSVTLGLLTGNIRQTAYLKLRPYQLDELFPFGAFGCDHIQRTELPPIAIRRANAYLASISQTTHGKELRSTEDDAHFAPFAPQHTMIIGDTLNDITCARAHNIPVLAVASGAVSYERLAERKPEFLVHDFSDTSTILNILLN